MHENVAQALTSIKLQLDPKVTATLTLTLCRVEINQFFKAQHVMYIRSERAGSTMRGCYFIGWVSKCFFCVCVRESEGVFVFYNYLSRSAQMAVHRGVEVLWKYAPEIIKKTGRTISPKRWRRWRCRVIRDVAFKTAEVSVSVKGGLFVPFAGLNSSAWQMGRTALSVG